MNRPSTLALLAIALIGLTAASPAIQDASAQSADREKILNSADWKQTIQDLHEWSSVQQIYDEDQLAKKKQELDDKIKTMSAEQLTQFLSELKQKLKILNSDEARKARTWLDETMAVAAPAYAQKIREKFPDIAELTPAQLQLQLDAYQNQIAAKKQYASDYAKEREAQVKQIRDQRIRDQQARLKSEVAAETPRRSNYNFAAPKIRTYRSYPTIWGGYRW